MNGREMASTIVEGSAMENSFSARYVQTMVAQKTTRPKFFNAYKGIELDRRAMLPYPSFRDFRLSRRIGGLRPVTGSKRKLHGEVMLPLST